VVRGPALFLIYLVPFYQDWALRELRAFLDLPGARVAVISHDPQERLRDDLQSRIVGHWRVDDILSTDQIIWAASELQRRHGSIDRFVTGQEHTQLQVAEARAALGIPGMSVEATRAFRDKSRMKELLRAGGVPCARYGLARDEPGAWQIARQIGYPLVVKPHAGAGTVSTFRVESDEALRQALTILAPRFDQPVQLEEFISGTEHTIETFSNAGQHLWHSMTDYLPSPLEVMRNPWIQMCGLLPREVDDPRHEGIREVAVRALDVLGMDTGVSHMEWFRRPDGSIVVSEVAARPPGGELMTYMSRAHDFDAVAAWARLVVTGVFHQPPQRRFAVAGAYLRAQGAGERIVAVHGVDAMLLEVGQLITDMKLPQIGQEPKWHYSGEGFVILRHPETDVARRAIMRVVNLVRVWAG
jgi:biotin carboxylase